MFGIAAGVTIILGLFYMRRRSARKRSSAPAR